MCSPSLVSKEFAWDEAERLPVILQDGSTKYVTGPDGLPLEQVSSSGVLYYDQDQLGSTRGLLDQSRTTVATYTYDAYGTVTSSTGTVANPFQYAGQYTDAESGLQYLRARYYDPSTAQFLTVDPLASVTGQPYSYAGGNTLSASDPSGLMPGAFGGGGGGMVPSWGAYDGIPMTGFAGYPVPDEPCTCGGDGLASVATWLSRNPGVVALVAGIAAIVLGVAVGSETAAVAVIVLNVVASAAALGQIARDLQDGNGQAAILDTVSAVTGMLGIGLAFRVLRYLSKIAVAGDGLVVALQSGDVLRAFTIAARALALNRLRRSAAELAGRLGGISAAAGLLGAAAASGRGGGAC